MKFELDEDEQKKLDEWKGHINAIFGEYGDYTYHIRFNGIAYTLKVESHLAKVSIDLTDVTKW